MKHNPRQIKLVQIKRQIIGLDQPRSAGRIIKNSSFYRIPAVRKYIVGERHYNPILASIGINLREKSRPKYEENKNNRMNKYMAHTIRQIRLLVKQGEGSKAWRLIKRTMEKSQAFRMSAFNHVMKGWHYKMSKSEVWKIMRELDRIIKSGKTNVDIKRVYIPKPNGKQRPLGVPSKSWRIYLHMLNGFLLELLKPTISLNQHGFQPGKGVKSSWKELLNKNFKNVYETDLKNYFNEVSSWKIRSKLEQIAPEEDLGKYVFELLKSTPKFPAAKPSNGPDESQYQEVKGYDKGFFSESTRESLSIDLFKMQRMEEEKPMVRGASHWHHTPRKPRTFDDLVHLDNVKIKVIPIKTKIEEFEEASKEEILKEEMKKSEGTSLKINIPRLNFRRSELENKNFGITPGGVPQGLPIGPLLAISIGKEYLEQEESVSYADDQIFFPKDSNTKIKDDPVSGIQHAPEKCGWITKEKVWKTPELKFLGFTLSKEYIWRSKTRKGTIGKLHRGVEQMFTDEGVDLIKKLPNLEKKTLCELGHKINSIVVSDRKAVLRNLSKSKLFGFVMSCMILDDWTNSHAEMDQMKATKNKVRNIHKKSLLATEWAKLAQQHSLKFPENLQSSLSIYNLTHVVSQTMRKHVGKYKKPKSLKVPWATSIN